MTHCVRVLALTVLWSCVCFHIYSAEPVWDNGTIVLGDEKTESYLPLLAGKRVAVLSNHTGRLSCGTHVLDTLVASGVEVTTLFSPEHGFRGEADAGEHVGNSVDRSTGIPIFSLYDGKEPKPADEVMQRFDVLVVDIQDVGLRFYTYYVTMLRLMRRCADLDREVVILDRPNPNGHYVDGPTLDMDLKSGVGALPIPVVHGQTLGELAFMATGEGWVPPCRLTVIPCSRYTHQSHYRLPLAPSPNLPCMAAVYLYPSTCYFEGTCISLGRGTDRPFQVYGHPLMKGCTFTFTPQSRPGAKRPPLMDEECHGVDLSTLTEAELQQFCRVDLSYVVDAYRRMEGNKDFFLKNNFFDKLIGQRRVRHMIEQGCSAEEIRATWQEDVALFKALRRKYLLYPE